MDITQTESWKDLEHLALAYSNDNSETIPLTLSAADITLDFTTQRADKAVHNALLELASECQLELKIEALFAGERVNSSENRPALHTALRAPSSIELWVDGHNVMPEVASTRLRMRDIAEAIREGQWLGYSGKAITDVVNIGIGGSQLGPMFCIHAFAEHTLPALSFHFISDMDPAAFPRVTKSLNPETTLFIVSSKSFTTAETLYNLKLALAWVKHPEAIDSHFIAVTAAVDKASSWGIKHVLPIWDWVGGRYSICSAINLITCIAVGFDCFSEFLEGAYEMDKHFRFEPLACNLPVQLALFGIWNNNFLKIQQLLLLTYGNYLDYFSAYVQQLDMESNGKSLDRYGRAVNYATGPIIWGGSANQAQHSYYQLLCQGTHRIAIDLINVDSFQDFPIHQLCLAQKEVLANGFGDAADLNSFVKGQVPMNYIRLRDHSPRTLGALVALYEHKIYTQSVIWQINPFDQPGVESSKCRMRENVGSYAFS